jgi:glycosyltransferase involved in cell wall biosynthesis
MFVGTLSPGKRPLYAVQLVAALRERGIDMQLSLYGHGVEKQMLENYIGQNKLEKNIFKKGNQPRETVQEAFTQSHFVMLPSQSEGWPKVVAEGMFWGCLPVASRVSCVSSMLNQRESRGLLDMDFEKDASQLETDNPAAYVDKVEKSIAWSRQYTMDVFENEIKMLLQP